MIQECNDVCQILYTGDFQTLNVSLESLGLPSNVLVWQVILMTTVSLGVGFLGGLIGLALGTMRLPVLLLLGVPVPVAAGTNIMVSTLSALTGAVRHYRDGRVDFHIVIIMGAPACIGALIGGLSSRVIPENALIMLVGLLVFWQGIELLARVREKQPKQADGRPIPRRNFNAGRGRVVVSSGTAFGVGILAGGVGLILGTLRLPIMIRILGTNPRVAAGSNLFIGFIMGSMGWVGHLVNGQVDAPLLIMLAVSGMVGSYFGARLTGQIPLQKLLFVMGAVLLLSGIALIGKVAVS